MAKYLFKTESFVMFPVMTTYLYEDYLVVVFTIVVVVVAAAAAAAAECMNEFTDHTCTLR